MANKPIEIPKSKRAMRARIVELSSHVQSLELLVEKLRLQLGNLKRLQFGSSSEHLSRQIAQMELALEGLEREVATEKATKAPASDEPEPARMVPLARHPGRKPLPAHLPREDVLHGEHDPLCPCTICGGTMRRAGADEISEQLECVPGHLKVLRHRRPKFSCLSCGTMSVAAAGARPIDRGLPGPALLSHVLVSKFCDHLPLYRQNQMFARQGIEIERSTLTGWVASAHRLLSPLAREISNHVIGATKLHADDTPVKVLAPGTGRTKTGRLWGYVRDDRRSGSPTPPAVWFCYSGNRKGEHPAKHLAHFKGTLQADAYSGFDPIYQHGEVIAAGCWAHARRKFFELHVAQASPIAREALERIGELYAIEREIKGQPPDVRAQVRQARAGPELVELHRWLVATLARVSSGSALAAAIRYSLSRWRALTRYVHDGRVEIDNNICVREVRAVSVVRKNYLFFGSDRGGERAATMYSLIGTCKLNGIDPEAYLRYVLARINDHKINRLQELLPWNVAPLLANGAKRAA